MRRKIPRTMEDVLMIYGDDLEDLEQFIEAMIGDAEALGEMEAKDARPDAKPRKHPTLYQAYWWYDKIRRLRIGSVLRQKSILRKKSDMSLWFEAVVLKSFGLLEMEKSMQRAMVAIASEVGLIFDWATSIKGLGTGNHVAQILALTDDVGKFPLPSKYNRFAGLAVINGKGERYTEHYCRKLKALLLGPGLICDQFMRQRTPVYRAEYDRAKMFYQGKFPLPICNKCDGPAVKAKTSDSYTWRCADGCNVPNGFKVRYTPLHIEAMTKRKVARMFMTHLWVQWRKYENLPVTVPYILRPGTGHSHYVAADGSVTPVS